MAKKLFCFYFLLVIVIYNNLANAGGPYCVSGYNYNSSTNKCEAEPLCPGGWYDTTTYSSPICLANATYTCLSSEYALDPELFMCVTEPTCCASASLVITSGNAYCDEGHSHPCNCDGYGGIGGEDDNWQTVCRHAPDCLDGGNLFWAGSGNPLCWIGKTISCPSGYLYWGYERICYATPQCPNGGSFVSHLDKCQAASIPDEYDDCGLGVGRPVNVASGAVYTSIIDFSLKGTMPINFVRYYKSTGALSRGFGYQWSHSFDTRIMSLQYNLYKVINPDGSVFYYNDTNGDGIYEADVPKGLTSSVVKSQDGTFMREFKEGDKEEFNASGYLMAVVDKNGNRITLTRDINNRLTKIADGSGREIIITNAPGKIDSITLPDGRKYIYTYETFTGNLGKITYPDGSTLNYEYIYLSGLGYRLKGIKNEMGNYIENHTYDSQGRAITSSADGTNELLTINYISDTQSTVTDAFGRVKTYNFERNKGKNYPTNITGPGCQSCGQSDVSKTYDEDLNVTSATDANGNITAMTYDAAGNMLTKTEAFGTVDERTTAYTYNSFGEVLTDTNNDGIITSYTYDASGNMLTKTEAFGTADERTASYTYNAYGQILSTTDPKGNTITNTYDQYGNLATVTNALNQATTYVYDLMGNLISMTDANGNTTTYEYDSRDRLKKETRPNGGVINYEYDAAGNRTAVIDANGNRTDYTYDNLNRLIKTTDPEGNTTNYTYDAENNMTSMAIKKSSDHVITSESYTYDDHNRLTSTMHADNSYTEQTYDAVGNILTKRDENGNVITYAYDALNRLISITDANGGVTSYTYDSRDNLTSVTDANGNITTYAYDNLNRLVSTASPDTGTATYTYDANANMITKTDANGVTTTYLYDSLNRLTELRTGELPFAPTELTTYVYDNCLNGKGRLCIMTDLSGTTWYDYDKMGRVTMETKQIDGLNYQTEYTYDLNGNITSITYPGGRVITYTYNQLNKVVSVAETYIGVTRTLANNITYQPFKDILSMTYGNGIVTTKTYDNRNRLNGLNVGTLKQLSYSRDNAGNITAIMDALDQAKNKNYTYDALNRLKAATGDWGTLTYEYDPVGNRTYETTDTGNTIYNYTADTNKLASSTGEQTFNFNYDNNGNTVSENGRQYIYNENQRLTQVTDTDTVLGEYVYNGKGQRVKKCTDNGTQCTIFHYDQQGLLIAESTDTGTITNEYVYLNGQPLAKIGSKVSGSGYNQPAPMYNASMSVSVDSSSLETGWLKYYYTRTRLNLASASITGLTIAGSAVTVTGVGTVNGAPDYTFTAAITDGSPDAISIEIYRPDGTLHYKDPAGGGSRALIRGNFTLASNVYYYHNDHLGTPALITDGSGSVVWQGEFKPFGESVSITGSITNNLRFPGQHYDSETRLHQNWHRDYKPEIGRYIESDPILQPMISKPIKSSCSKSTITWRVPSLISNPQDLQPYLYTANNPVNFSDLSGLSCGPGNWGDYIVPDEPVLGYDFDPACDWHDDCYGECGKTRFQCDRGFYQRMLAICSQGSWLNPTRLLCINLASVYFTAVRIGGILPYFKAQRASRCHVGC